MIIRRERPTDRATSRAVQAAAFAQGESEPNEARLLDELRGCDGWLPALSWVAEVDGQVIGHNLCTRGYVGDIACVGLGPIGIRPQSQRSGVGSALMYAMIGAADALGEPLIGLLGSPDYYSRFGFAPSDEFGIAAPDPQWGVYFQILPLTMWDDSITGSFRYAAPFDQIT